MRAMCHHHLVSDQLKWEENNSVEEIKKKEKEMKERKRKKRKGRRGRRRKDQ